MRIRSTIACLVITGISAGCSRPGTPAEQAAAALVGLRGKLERDPKPDGPVVVVDLSSLSITDADVALLAFLPQLREVNLFGCPVGDSAMPHVAKCPGLTVLKLGSTRVTGAGLATLAALKALRTLNLSRTEIGDADLPHLAVFPSLEQLDLRRTKITDQGLPHLNALGSLRTINVAETAVTASAAARLQRALPQASVLRQRDP